MPDKRTAVNVEPGALQELRDATYDLHRTLSGKLHEEASTALRERAAKLRAQVKRKGASQ